MYTRPVNRSIIDELSEHVTLRMSSYLEQAHDGKWIEHKSHSDYDLWFITAGSVKITIHGMEHIAAPGDVVFFYPDMPYTASATGELCQFIYMHFDFSISEQRRILEQFQLSGIVPGKRICEETALFISSYQRLKHGSVASGSPLYLKATLLLVISKILELHGQGLYNGEFLKDGQRNKTEGNLGVLQGVFQYVDANLHRPIRVHELASIAGVSEKYFISLFKKTLGITPGQYMNQIKMNRARDYLYEKKYTIQQIAGFLGYPDPFTFSKAFKKVYHVPPSKFE
ncbi:helix-turn-helix transcriptional regulator [Paenibacillus sp. JNUCC31]|uniref:AraC family transcriptional regulator n=1 Tax=Paenibacillus sp. JNUCC-31 TaxID=2777983 RepID=UPI00178767B3|nr:AraC family transcriptional regulator [Paenibacillus sp. JNUCC-31]QOS78984.1 helix-turn-helix transcriptional regulator [Paenibacillus sp. JNUCC-31]